MFMHVIQGFGLLFYTIIQEKKEKKSILFPKVNKQILKMKC